MQLAKKKMRLGLFFALATSAEGHVVRAPVGARRLPALRARCVHCCAPVGDELHDLFLFDPLSDELPFPFPPLSPTNAVEDDLPSASSVMRYAFDRSIYLRMLRDALDDDGQPTGALIGHVCRAGDGEAVGALSLGSGSLVRVGAVGVALRLMDVSFIQRPGGAAAVAASAFGEEVASAAVASAFRFELVEVTSTFPYPRGRARRLRDATPAAPEACAVLEAELQDCLRDLVTLSTKLEGRGAAAEAAEAALAAPSALLEAHERAVVGGLYADATERFEAFSVAACDLLALPHAAAVACLATRCARTRFETILENLRPAVAELRALTSLDDLGGAGWAPDGGASGGGDGAGFPGGGGAGAGAGGFGGFGFANAAAAGGGGATGAAAGADARESMLGGTTSFSPIDIPVGGAADGGLAGGGGGLGGLGGGGAPGGGVPAPKELPDGARVEYWYNEEYGWTAATVMRRVRGAAGELLHTLAFDVDGTWEEVPLEFSNGVRRWRPLRE